MQSGRLLSESATVSQDDSSARGLRISSATRISHSDSELTTFNAECPSPVSTQSPKHAEGGAPARAARRKCACKRTLGDAEAMTLNKRLSAPGTSMGLLADAKGLWLPVTAAAPPVATMAAIARDFG